MVERYIPKRAITQLRQARVGVNRKSGEILRSQTKRAKTESDKQQIARQYDNFFQESEFASLNELKQQYNNVPTEIKNRMNFNYDKAVNQQKNRVSEIQRQISLSKEDEEIFDKKNDKAKEKRERARQAGLREGLQRLQQGEIINISDIRNYADKLSTSTYKQALKQQKVKTVKLVRTTLKIDGKVISGFKDPRTNVFSPGPSSRKDFQTIKSKYKTTSLPKLINVEIKQQQEKEVDKLLGNLAKIYSPAQKEIIRKSFFVSTSRKAKVEVQFSKIDKRKDLSIFDKEKLKRQVIGIKTPTVMIKPMIKQRLTSGTIKSINQELKNIKLSPQSRRITGETLTPTDLKNLKKYDDIIVKKRFEKNLKELYNIGKGFILNEAEFVALGLTGVQKLTEKSISGMSNLINYFTTRTDVIVKQGKGFVIGKTYTNQDINNILKTDAKNAYNKSTRIAKNVLKGYNKAWSSTTIGTKFILEHPYESAVIVGTFAALMAEKSKKLGNEYLRKLQKQPGDTIGRTLSFIYGGQAMATSKEAGIVIKAKYSPTVIKNVKILDSFAEKGTGNALKMLEGKKIDLFHATTAKLKDLFKSTPITEKQLNFLLKDMKKTPGTYLKKNYQLKSLDTIANSRPKAIMLDAIKNKPDIILSGSGSLAVQTKKFRKVGDIDVMARSPIKTSEFVVQKLNNTLLGKIVKNRYKSLKNKWTNTYQIFDTFKVGYKILISKQNKYGILWKKANNNITQLRSRLNKLNSLLKSQKGKTRKTTQKQINKTKKDIKDMNKFVSKLKTKINNVEDKLKDYIVMDIADLNQWEDIFGKAKSRKIDDVNVLEIEESLLVKTKISQDPDLLKRRKKELKDIKLILGKKINIGKFGLVSKIFEKNNLLKAEAFKKASGTSRRFDWAQYYLGDLNLPFGRNEKIEKKIIKRLKDEWGISEKEIMKKVDQYTPTDMYFAPNQIYSLYLLGDKKQAILMAKDIKISAYGKQIQDLLKKHYAGLTTSKEKGKLFMLMRDWRKKNINKAYVGQKALADKIGEFEILVAEFSKFYPKKTLFNREVYIPVLNKFVRVQEVYLGKLPPSKLRKFYNKLKRKMKKGYILTEMKKDIIKTSNELKIKSKKKYESLFTEKGRKKVAAVQKRKKTIKEKKKLQEIEQIKKEKEFLKSERERIKKSDIPTKEKQRLLRKITPRKVQKYRASTLLKLRKLIKRDIDEAIKRVPVKPPVRVTKPIPRPVKEIKPGKITPRPVKEIITKTPIITITKETPTKPPIKPPKITTKPTPKPHIPKLQQIPKKEYKNKVLLFKAFYRERRNMSNPFNRKTNPVIVKSQKLKTTHNRALKKVADLADTKAIRSIQLKLIGITKKKIKDIKTPGVIKKFRIKKGTTRDVLKFVEKSKYALDKKTEIRELAIAKAKKKSKHKSKSTTKKTKKLKKASKSKSNKAKLKKRKLN